MSDPKKSKKLSRFLVKDAKLVTTKKGPTLRFPHQDSAKQNKNKAEPNHMLKYLFGFEISEKGVVKSGQTPDIVAIHKEGTPICISISDIKKDEKDKEYVVLKAHTQKSLTTQELAKVRKCESKNISIEFTTSSFKSAFNRKVSADLNQGIVLTYMRVERELRLYLSQLATPSSNLEIIQSMSNLGVKGLKNSFSIFMEMAEELEMEFGLQATEILKQAFQVNKLDVTLLGPKVLPLLEKKK